MFQVPADMSPAETGNAAAVIHLHRLHLYRIVFQISCIILAKLDGNQ